MRILLVVVALLAGCTYQSQKSSALYCIGACLLLLEGEHSLEAVTSEQLDGEATD